MSTPWVEARLNYTQSVVNGLPLYGCDITIEAVYGIPNGIFVWGADNEQFNHVAVADELDLYPATRAEALSVGKAFYRQPRARLQATSPAKLLERVAHLQLRIRELLQAWGQPTDLSFPSQQTIVLSGEPA